MRPSTITSRRPVLTEAKMSTHKATAAIDQSLIKNLLSTHDVAKHGVSPTPYLGEDTTIYIRLSDNNAI